jgi:hypothetical protein
MFFSSSINYKAAQAITENNKSCSQNQPWGLKGLSLTPSHKKTVETRLLRTNSLLTLGNKVIF